MFLHASCLTMDNGLSLSILQLLKSLKNPTMLGSIAGSALMRKAASVAFENKKRSTLTTDIIECLGRRY